MRPVSRARTLPKVGHTSLKICLTGDRGVGKTSLLGRYLQYEADGRYFPTVGPRIYGKRVGIRLSDHGLTILTDLEIWDSGGDPGLAAVIKHAFFHAVDGIVAVCDATRPESLSNMDYWLANALDVVKGPKIAIAVNKTDLKHPRLRPAEIEVVAQAYSSPYVFVSAYSGENVDNLFAGLVIDILRRKVRRRPFLPTPMLA